MAKWGRMRQSFVGGKEYMQANAVRIECYFSQKKNESHQPSFWGEASVLMGVVFFLGGGGANYSKQSAGFAGGILPRWLESWLLDRGCRTSRNWMVKNISCHKSPSESVHGWPMNCGGPRELLWISTKNGGSCLDWYNRCIILLLMEEIRLTPVEVGSLSHYLHGFSTIPGGAGFQPSTVSLFNWNLGRVSWW